VGDQATHQNFSPKNFCLQSTAATNDPSLDLSRGDFKVCHQVFQEEVTEAGFVITGIKTIGPIETIGGSSSIHFSSRNSRSHLYPKGIDGCFYFKTLTAINSPLSILRK